MPGAAPANANPGVMNGQLTYSNAPGAGRPAEVPALAFPTTPRISVTSPRGSIVGGVTVMSPRITARPSVIAATGLPPPPDMMAAMPFGAQMSLSQGMTNEGYKLIETPAQDPAKADHNKVVVLQAGGGAAHAFSSPFGFSSGEAQETQQATSSAAMSSAAAMGPPMHAMQSAPVVHRQSITHTQTYNSAPPPMSAPPPAVPQAPYQDMGRRYSTDMAMGPQLSLQIVVNGQPMQPMQVQGGQRLSLNGAPPNGSYGPPQGPGPQHFQMYSQNSAMMSAPPSYQMGYGAGPPPQQMGYPPMGSYGGPPPRSQPSSGPPVVMAGWLSKRGDDWKMQWSTKWFALYPGGILTYSGEEGGMEERRIQLHPSTQARTFESGQVSGEAKLMRMKKPYGFELFQGHGNKTWLVDAGSRDKRDLWIAAINQATAQMRAMGGMGGAGSGCMPGPGMPGPMSAMSGMQQCGPMGGMQCGSMPMSPRY
eukprot:TRINITY_DN14494_c0_g1_i1.p1 TRINITY_DN14494_c0_g1~~TRINITY_DN14494_c0_g1_i1.p1  ORF type:complete len:528 (-),score=91.24 TRINITY_DN14494_c0_g1_i1:169-1602(-)